MVKRVVKKENVYLVKLKKLVLGLLRDEPLKVVVFGSRARQDNQPASDVDIGIIPRGKIDKGKIAELRYKIEGLNIPYKVELVDLSQTSDSFKKEAMKEVVVWKD